MQDGSERDAARGSFQKLGGPIVNAKTDIVRRRGSHAVHKQATAPPQTAVAGLRELFHSLYWFARTCAGKNHELPTPGMAFDTAAIPHLISPRPVSRNRPNCECGWQPLP
ncbi:hypothetical protein [Streptomyces sp. NPDC088246]|uniref:hypothetical protein n=1 Tax=Streptomyces sp. NPDC088246 TaxID=3365842 RepID=UPI0038228247